ncbi:MAG: DNA polymerase IV [Planctomycetota bacterium]|jgi:DNA polymerase-4
MFISGRMMGPNNSDVQLSIMHVDMDAFYASVEERDEPSLKGKPVVVGGSAEGRGVVSAANYVARKYGIHSAMPAGRAKRLCPHAVFIKPRIRYYSTVSEHIFRIFRDYTPLIEPLSLDEAFLDVSGCERLLGDAVKIGREIQNRVRGELGLSSSVGIAPNKYLAKLASDLKKPNGFVVIPEESKLDILGPLAVSRLWGIGKVAQERLDKAGLHTIGQIRELSIKQLAAMFGVWGEKLYYLARGEDTREVVPEHEAKSISHETTFHKDISNRQELIDILLDVADNLAARIRRHNLWGRTLTLKVRYHDFRRITRSKSLPAPTQHTLEIYNAAKCLLINKVSIPGGGVRLLGIGLSNLTTAPAFQKDLFGACDDEQEKLVDAVVDVIRNEFGRDAISRGGLS